MISAEILQSHENAAKKMDWDDLATIIIKYELWLYEMKSDLTSEDFDDIDRIIKVYEKEKLLRLSKLTYKDYSKWL